MNNAGLKRDEIPHSSHCCRLARSQKGEPRVMRPLCENNANYDTQPACAPLISIVFYKEITSTQLMNLEFKERPSQFW